MAEYMDELERLNRMMYWAVTRTKDEFGILRYFITDHEGNWIGNAFDTPEAAFEEIDRLRADE